MSVTRNPRLIAPPLFKVEPTGGDQPLDFSVRSSSNSPSPQQTRSHNSAESLLMLSQTGGVQSPCSSSSSSEPPQHQTAEQRQIAVARSRRKPANGDVQRRGVAVVPQHEQAEGPLVVGQGDSASPAWQSSAANGAANHTTSSESSSSSTHRPQPASSIPPDSTTASMDGDVDGEDDNGERIKVRTANGVVNRRRPRAMPDERKDESYWERRRKNNEAAKRSRDARRQKEDDVAGHCRQLEQENKRLRDEIAELRAVIEQLRAEVLARQQRAAMEANGENSENCDPVVDRPRESSPSPSSNESPDQPGPTRPAASDSSGDESDEATAHS